jgi:hypothetical protein
VNIETLLGYCKALTDYGKMQNDIIDGVLVIAGTNSIDDWSINLNVNKVAGYHEGFYNTALSLPVKKSIKLVTGYSLGGAVAHIYSMMYNVKCISFNAPKCLADKPSIKLKQISRFSIDNDFITNCPLTFYHPLCKSYTFHGGFSNPHSIDNFIDCISNARLLLKFSDKLGTTPVRQ